MDHLSQTVGDESTPAEPASERVINCYGCGYSLQGLAVDGTCPECGASVATSVEAARGFTKRELAHFACKLFAIWMFLSAGSWLLELVGMLSYYIQQSQTQPVAVVWFSTAVIAPGLLGGLMWWRANWLAGLIVRRDGVASVGPLNRRDLLHIALAIVGIYLVATGIETFLRVLTHPQAGLWSTYDLWSWLMVVPPVVRTALGFGLIIGASGLSRVIAYARSMGVQND